VIYNLIWAVERFLSPFLYLWQQLQRLLSFGSPQREYSLAAKISIGLGVLLLLCWGTILIATRFSGGSLPWDKFFIYAPLFGTAACLAAYFGIRLLKYETPSPYPEIDRVFSELQTWADAEKIDLASVPMFLVLGTVTEDDAKRLHQNPSGKAFKLGGKPSGENEWMHWFANTECIYLHLKSCSSYNESLQNLNSRSGKRTRAEGTGTIVVSESVFGSLDGNDSKLAEDFDSLSGSGYLDRTEPLGTITGDNLPEQFDSIEDAEFGAEDAQAGYMSLEDNRLERLKYTCRLLVRLAPNLLLVRGAMLLLPASVLKQKSFAALAESVRIDLKTISEGLGAELPLEFLVNGMEQWDGFVKFQSLLDSKEHQKGRLGAGIKLEEPISPILENIQLLVDKACYGFDAILNDKFKSSSRLGEAKKNKALLQFLIKVHSEIRPSLVKCLTTFLSDSEGNINQQFLPLGVYFASTGNETEPAAFLNGAVMKLQECENLATWTSYRREQDRWYALGSKLLIVGGLACLIATAVLLRSTFGQASTVSDNEPAKSSQQD
jgi:hypothetical protein